eukprot:s508_g13.t1
MSFKWRGGGQPPHHQSDAMALPGHPVASWPPALQLLLLGVALTLLSLLKRLIFGRGSAPFRVIDTQDRGKALVAARSFRAGEVIFTEKALLSIPVGSQILAPLGFLAPSLATRLLKLHGHEKLSGEARKVFGEYGEHLVDQMEATGLWSAQRARTDAARVWKLLGVWEANKLSFTNSSGRSEQCVFEQISRLNHSCEPNVRLLPGASGELQMMAAGGILRGEELCICYPETWICFIPVGGPN